MNAFVAFGVVYIAADMLVYNKIDAVSVVVAQNDDDGVI